MALTISEVAEVMGLSAQSVRAMVRRGDVPARRVAGRWLISDAGLAALAPRPPGRPLGARMTAALMAVVDGGRVADLTPVERGRLVRQVERLRSAEDPARLLHAWTVNRPGAVLRLSAAGPDVPGVASDPRVRPTGRSDPRSGLVQQAQEFEGWIGASDVAALSADHFLVPEAPGNIELLVREDGGALPERPLPLSWIVVDLARRPGPRERARVAQLLAEVLPPRDAGLADHPAP